MTSDTAPAAMQQKRKTRHIVDTAETQRTSERTERERRQVEAGQNQAALEDDPFQDIAVNVMREFVRQHHFDLVVGVFREHRV